MIIIRCAAFVVFFIAPVAFVLIQYTYKDEVLKGGLTIFLWMFTIVSALNVPYSLFFVLVPVSGE